MRHQLSPGRGGPDHGAVTVETAVVTPALILLLAVLLAAAAAGMTTVRFEEAARASARAAARGDDSATVVHTAHEIAGHAASIQISTAANRVTVAVSGPAPGVLGHGATGGCTRTRRPPWTSTEAIMTAPERAAALGGSAQDPDAGSGTVHGVTLAVMLCFLLIAVLLVAQAAILTHRAAKAADLAALAAADVARGLSPGVPCDMAARVATENGAQLEECSLVAPENTTVDVIAVVALPQPLTALGPATGLTRAGPPPDEP